MLHLYTQLAHVTIIITCSITITASTVSRPILDCFRRRRPSEDCLLAVFFVRVERSAYVRVLWTGYKTSFLTVLLLIYLQSAVTQRVFGCSSPSRFDVLYATAHCYCVTMEVPIPNTLHCSLLKVVLWGRLWLTKTQ